jgi:monoterpene epsilon-lactone hydrolase
VLVAAIDYRLAPRYPYPAALEDVLAACAWLRQTAEPIGMLGSSAGGHLALVAALQMPLAFAIADAPVSDPVADLKSRGAHPFWPDTAAALEGSPLAAVEAGRYRALPPLLISHGDRDELVPLVTSERFVAAYRAAGGHADLEVFRGLGHAFMLSNPRGSQAKRLARQMLAFITAHADAG